MQPQPALGFTATIDHHVLHAAPCIDLHIQRRRQQLTGGQFDILPQRYEATTMRFAPATQSHGIGARAGAADRKQALIRRHRRQLFRPIGQQAIAEQQVFLHARLRLPLRQRAGTVRAHGLQGCAQLAPVAGADAESTHRLGAIPQYGQRHAAVTQRSEIAIQQGELTCAIALARRAGTVPQQPDLAGQRARRAAGHHRQLRQQVMAVLPGRHLDLRLTCCRQVPLQLLRQLRALALPQQLARADAEGCRTCSGRAGCLQFQFNRGRAGGELQRQRPLPALAGEGQRLANHQLHAPATAGRQRVDAQPELVASGLFQQARVDPATGDLLEHLAAAILGHRHRVTHLAVDIQREAADLLTVGQRELQLALQHAPVRVVEFQCDPGLGDAGLDFAFDAGVSQLHRLLGGRGNQQRHAGLRPGDRRRLRASGPGREGQQQHSAATDEDHERTPVGS